jgi:hypothetical protein
MKKRLNLLLILSSLIGYLEWAGGNHGFLIQMEYGLLFGDQQHAENFAHPIIMLPLAGQFILIYTLFQKTPSRFLSIVGLACLSVLMLLLTFIAIADTNWRIGISVLPFLIIGALVIRAHWKKPVVENK